MTRLRSMKRRLGVSLVAFGLVSLALFHNPRPAQAQMTLTHVQKAVEWILRVYGWYMTGKNILNPAASAVGPDIGGMLHDLQDAIYGELRLQRNQLWSANARTVLTTFESMTLRQAGDGSLPLDWSNTRILALPTLNQFAELVIDGQDYESAYHLGPAFNALQVAATGLEAMKKQIFGFPATWFDFNVTLQQTMNVNYYLVGSPEFLCWPGGNPGKHFYGSRSAIDGWYGKLSAMRGPPPIGTTVETLVSQPIPRSQMWRWLGRASTSVLVYGITVQAFNNNIGDGIEWGTGQCRVNDTVFDTHNGPSCTGNCVGSALIKVDGRTTNFACNSTQCFNPPAICRPMIMFTAQWLFKQNTFDKDPNVQVVQTAMRAISHLGGGDDRFSRNDTVLPTQGQMVDPWADEPICDPSPGNGGAPNPWAYPNDPDPTCAHGIERAGVCCDAACGACAISGCSGLPGGGGNCCSGTIKARGVSCGQSGAPCVMGDPTCETGVTDANRTVCCAAMCGRCGGSECSRRWTGGPTIDGGDECCLTNIRNNGRSCLTNPPPCVMP